jgi:hypothetical protein
MNPSMFNTTQMNASIINTTIPPIYNDPEIEDLIYIILLGSVVVCACCIGAVVCWKESKHTAEYVKWVRMKKGLA